MKNNMIGVAGKAALAFGLVAAPLTLAAPAFAAEALDPVIDVTATGNVVSWDLTSVSSTGKSGAINVAFDLGSGHATSLDGISIDTGVRDASGAFQHSTDGFGQISITEESAGSFVVSSDQAPAGGTIVVNVESKADDGVESVAIEATSKHEEAFGTASRSIILFNEVGGDPTDPTDPVDPVDPVDPDPVDPVDPGPVDPVDPGTGGGNEGGNTGGGDNGGGWVDNGGGDNYWEWEDDGDYSPVYYDTSDRNTGNSGFVNSGVTPVVAAASIGGLMLIGGGTAATIMIRNKRREAVASESAE